MHQPERRRRFLEGILSRNAECLRLIAESRSLDPDSPALGVDIGLHTPCEIVLCLSAGDFEEAERQLKCRLTFESMNFAAKPGWLQDQIKQLPRTIDTVDNFFADRVRDYIKYRRETQK
jgi:hypothetical protein